MKRRNYQKTNQKTVPLPPILAIVIVFLFFMGTVSVAVIWYLTLQVVVTQQEVCPFVSTHGCRRGEKKKSEALKATRSQPEDRGAGGESSRCFRQAASVGKDFAITVILLSVEGSLKTLRLNISDTLRTGAISWTSVQPLSTTMECISSIHKTGCDS